MKKVHSFIQKVLSLHAVSLIPSDKDEETIISPPSVFPVRNRLGTASSSGRLRRGLGKQLYMVWPEIGQRLCTALPFRLLPRIFVGRMGIDGIGR
jgi:hypothetical protein